MNSKLLITTAVLNIMILILSVGYYYKIVEPKIILAEEMAVKINPLPEGAAKTFNNYADKEKKQTIESITSLYNQLTDYVASQNGYNEKAINSLNQYVFIMFLLLCSNSILLVYIVLTSRHNKTLKFATTNVAGLGKKRRAS